MVLCFFSYSTVVPIESQVDSTLNCSQNFHCFEELTGALLPAATLFRRDSILLINSEASVISNELRILLGTELQLVLLLRSVDYWGDGLATLGFCRYRVGSSTTKAKDPTFPSHWTSFWPLQAELMRRYLSFQV